MERQAYKPRYNSVKQRKGGQLSLFDTEDLPAVAAVGGGAEVNRALSGRAEWWLADCSREKTATQDLMSAVTDLSNLSRACKRVIANGGSGGVDGMNVEELREWFAANHEQLRKELIEGTYRPQAVRGVKIPKPNGGERQLGIPTVIDRLVQQAIHQVLSPRYEPTFSELSFGFRPQRGAHDALLQAGEYMAAGKSYIVDIDLAKFFDEVNHDRLSWLLSRRIGDSRLLKLISRYLKSGMLEGGLTSQRVKGTPQGGPLSPLLSNIVLDELDKELESRGHCFVRYADDLIVMVGSGQSANRVFDSLINFVENRLRLRVNREKSGIRRGRELNFLGHGILDDGSLMLSRESEKRLKDKLRERTRRNRGVSFGQVIGEIDRLLRGWLSYFRFARMKSRLQTVESWLKRRLRCYRLKQCKRAIGIHRFLSKLGVPNDRSWTTASNRRGWWAKALTPAAHEGMDNGWFMEVGLLRITEHYSKLHS